MNKKEFDRVKFEKYKERVVLGSLLSDLSRVAHKELWRKENGISRSSKIYIETIKSVCEKLLRMYNEELIEDYHFMLDVLNGEEI